jgi:hypothetical protein
MLSECQHFTSYLIYSDFKDQFYDMQLPYSILQNNKLHFCNHWLRMGNKSLTLFHKHLDANFVNSVLKGILIYRR